ncbi:glycoside hydrolase family 15 protein [Sphingobacterium sp. UBA6645]|uniref:glycoside hydrolase family 15 protein n=1 Tax=Sphingobacterium sp. UBA6645 TaxID=1947511 RepID=UPI0025DBD584|nr:glycoside hydrolase family 15 protein [Sphingobacterium sp. UBA6645]
MNKKHLYNSGIIGNCNFIAHVHKSTNINWLCWPTFRDSFVFGCLLDKNKGGEFNIRLQGDNVYSKQYYLENTNILVTEVHSDQGSFKVTDFAPRFEQYERFYKPLMLIRIVEPLEGNPKIKVTCNPKANYGLADFHRSRGSNHVQFNYDNEHMRLTTNIPISHFFDEDKSSIILSEKKYMVLNYGSAFEAALEKTAEDFLIRTKQYWRNWTKKADVPNFYQDQIIRSALVLKLHQYEDTGAIIASSTTSLPESPGSGRNWDYRYCWVRDSYYVLTALANIGKFDELEKFATYITGITQSDSGRLQPLYGILGRRTLTEETLDYLEGYLGNKPVRIGNQAYEHIQNDVYGQAMIALLPLFTDFRFPADERKDAKSWLVYILDKIATTIDEKDAGIWEFRHIANRHAYSNLFQWAGASAALKIAKQNGYQDIEIQAQELKDKAAAHIESCYDEERKVYRNASEGSDLDASTLQLIMMHYLDPNSERAKLHLNELEKVLKGKNGLFYRYLHQDDFGKPQSTFLVCAFWYVEALACVGRIDEAQEIFHNLMGYSNHLGLFSEDVHEEDGSQWGNFPQAYSHVGLMNAAYRIATKLDRPIFT